ALLILDGPFPLSCTARFRLHHIYPLAGLRLALVIYVVRQTMSQKGKTTHAGWGSLITGLSAGLAASFLVAWGSPYLATFWTQYKTEFDTWNYFLVFIPYHHDVGTWFKLG